VERRAGTDQLAEVLLGLGRAHGAEVVGDIGGGAVMAPLGGDPRAMGLP
jgi:hypothetical protein